MLIITLFQVILRTRTSFAKDGQNAVLYGDEQLSPGFSLRFLPQKTLPEKSGKDGNSGTRPGASRLPGCIVHPFCS